MAIFSTYFSAKPILSKGCLYNYISSDRSDGKTTNIKIQVVLDYFTNMQKHISMVIRRYKTEMTPAFYNNFLSKALSNIDDLQEITEEERETLKIASEYQYRYANDGIEVRKDDDDTWDRMCFFTPLSKAGKTKSHYDTYSERMFKIHFDEYIPLDGRYLPDEMTLLNELYTSVDRDRKVVRLLLYGNKIDLFNPFFNYFDLHIDIENAKLRTYRNNTLAVQIYINREHKEAREDDKLSELFSGTKYANYRTGAVLNQYMIKKGDITSAADYFCSFKSEVGEGTVWYDGNYIISCKQRRDGFVITDTIYNIDRQQYQINYGKFATTFRSMYRQGKVLFESNDAFHRFEPILRKAGN